MGSVFQKCKKTNGNIIIIIICNIKDSIQMRKIFKNQTPERFIIEDFMFYKGSCTKVYGTRPSGHIYFKD